MLQQQWPWLTPSGRPPSMSTALHLLISYTLLLYWTSKIVSPCRCTLVVYHSFCFKTKEKTCETIWKFRDVLFFCPSNTDLAIVFFLTREIKLVIIYCHDVMMTMITYLLAVQGALLPACVCMKGVLTVMTEWRRM